MKFDKIIHVFTLITTIFLVVYYIYLKQSGENMDSMVIRDSWVMIIALVILSINKVTRFMNKK